MKCGWAYEGGMGVKRDGGRAGGYLEFGMGCEDSDVFLLLFVCFVTSIVGSFDRWIACLAPFFSPGHSVLARSLGCSFPLPSARSLRSPAFHYRKSALSGDPFAMYKLGLSLLHGHLHLRPNPREALTWLTRASSLKPTPSPHALFELGRLYDGSVRVQGVEGMVILDEGYSFELYRRAADLGFPPAQHHLGRAYEHGLLSLPVNPALSVRYYADAAENGHPEAELALSGWYLTGAEGVVPQSDEEAYYWARRAAEKGLAKAEFAVGYYAENGVGISANREEALRWYSRAAEKGNKRAQAKVVELETRVERPLGFLGKLRSPGRKGGKKTAMSFLSSSTRSLAGRD